MSQNIKMDKASSQLFERLLKQRYLVEDGKVTEPIVRALRANNMDGFYHASDRGAKKVLLAIDRPIKIARKRRTLNKVIYRLDF